MNINEFKELQAHYRVPKSNPCELVKKYEILPRHVLLSVSSGVPLGVCVYRWFRDWLVRLKLIRQGKFCSAWSPRLKHVPVEKDPRVVLFWAVGAFDKQSLRLGLQAHLEEFRSIGGGLGVLLTNVPDFAFYSRLGWLVEYLPELTCSNESYSKEKLRYLAWRYRDADVITINCKSLHE